MCHSIHLPSQQRREPCNVFDLENGGCLARDVFIKTRGESGCLLRLVASLGFNLLCLLCSGDAFCFDAHSSFVWSFCTSSGKLERWVSMPSARPLEITPITRPAAAM